MPDSIGSPLASTTTARPASSSNSSGSASLIGERHGTRRAVTEDGTSASCRALPTSTSARSSSALEAGARPVQPSAPMPTTTMGRTPSGGLGRCTSADPRDGRLAGG